MKPMLAVGNWPPAVGGWKVRVSGWPLNAYERTTNMTGSALALRGRQWLAGEFVAADAAPRLNVGHSAWERRAAVSADDEVLGEEPRQSRSPSGAASRPIRHPHFVRQEVVKSQEIGNPDLHLDHDFELLDRDLHDGGRGHRLGDDNGVGEPRCQLPEGS